MWHLINLFILSITVVCSSEHSVRFLFSICTSPLFYDFFQIPPAPMCMNHLSVKSVSALTCSPQQLIIICSNNLWFSFSFLFYLALYNTAAIISHPLQSSMSFPTFYSTQIFCPGLQTVLLPHTGRGNLRPQLDSAMQDVSDLYLLMEETEKQAVRRALLEERGRYCTFINFLQPVVVRNIYASCAQELQS